MSEDDRPQLHYADFNDEGDITGAGTQDWGELPPEIAERIERDLREGVTFRLRSRRWYDKYLPISTRRRLMTNQVRWTFRGEENPLARAIIKQCERRRVSGLVLDGHRYWIIRRDHADKSEA